MSQTPSAGVGVSNNNNTVQQQPTDINSSLTILQEKIIYIDDDQPTSSDPNSDTQQRKKQIQNAITNISEFFIYYYQQECKFNLLDSSSGASNNNTTTTTSASSSGSNNLEIFYKNVTNFLNTSIQQLLRGCGDLSESIRTYSNEHLRKVIKSVIDTHSDRVLVILFRCMKPKANNKHSIISAISNFANISHYIKPQKCRTMVSFILPQLVQFISMEFEYYSTILENIIMNGSLDKIFDILGPYIEGNEIYDFCKDLYKLLSHSEVEIRRACARCISSCCAFIPSCPIHQISLDIFNLSNNCFDRTEKQPVSAHLHDIIAGSEITNSTDTNENTNQVVKKLKPSESNSNIECTDIKTLQGILNTYLNLLMVLDELKTNNIEYQTYSNIICDLLIDCLSIQDQRILSPSIELLTNLLSKFSNYCKNWNRGKVNSLISKIIYLLSIGSVLVTVKSYVLETLQQFLYVFPEWTLEAFQSNDFNLNYLFNILDNIEEDYLIRGKSAILLSTVIEVCVKLTHKNLYEKVIPIFDYENILSIPTITKASNPILGGSSTHYLIFCKMSQYIIDKIMTIMMKESFNHLLIRMLINSCSKSLPICLSSLGELSFHIPKYILSIIHVNDSFWGVKFEILNLLNRFDYTLIEYYERKNNETSISLSTQPLLQIIVDLIWKYIGDDNEKVRKLSCMNLIQLLPYPNVMNNIHAQLNTTNSLTKTSSQMVSIFERYSSNYDNRLLKQIISSDILKYRNVIRDHELTNVVLVITRCISQLSLVKDDKHTFIGILKLLSLVAKKYSYTAPQSSSNSSIKPVIAYYSIEILELLLDKLKYSSEISTDLSVHSMIIKTMGLYITQLKHLNEAKVLYITEHLLEYEQFMIDLITNVFDEQYIKQLSTIQSEYQKHMHKYVYDKLYNNIYQSAKSSISNAIIDSTYSRDAISIMRYQLLKTLYYILLNGSPACIEKYTISMIQYLNFNARFEKKYSILCIQELFVSLFGKKDKYYNLNIPSYESMKPVFINDEYDVISNNDVKKSNGLFDKIFIEGKKHSIYARRAMNSDLNQNRVRTRSLLAPYGETSTSPSKNTTGGGSTTPSKKAFSYDSQFLNTGKTYRQILGMFNPVVIGLTKYFKHTHDRSLQNVILFMLIRMICIGIDFSQLDKDSTFIKFIFNQLEKFDEPDFILYQIMDFLSVLLFIVKYQHFPENPFDSIVKLIQSTFNSSQFEKNGNSILKSISPVMIRGYLCEIRNEKVEKNYGNLMFNEFLKNVTLPECQSVLTLLLRNVHHSTITCSNNNSSTTSGNTTSNNTSNNTNASNSQKDVTSVPWIELSNSILKEWVVKHNLEVNVNWNLISNIANHFQTNNIATTYYNHTVNSNSGGLTSNSSNSNGNQSMNLKSNLVFQNRCKKEHVQYEFNNCEFIIELSKVFYFIDALYININDQAKIVAHLTDSFNEHLDQNSLEKQVQTPSTVQFKENINEKLGLINGLLKSLIYMKLLNRIDKKQANIEENLKNLERFLQSISNALNLYLNHRDTASIIVIKYLTCEMLSVTIELQERLYIKLLTNEHTRHYDSLNSIFNNQILHILKLFNMNYLKHYDFTIYTLLFSLLLAHSKVEKKFGISFLNYLYGFYHSNIYHFNILNNNQLLLDMDEGISSNENNLTYHEFVIQQKSVFLSMINITVNYQENIMELFKQCEINNLSNRIWKEIFNHFDEPLIEKFLEKFCRDICCENDLNGLFDELNDKFKSQLHLNDLRILFKFIKNYIKKEHLIWLHPKIINQLEERLKIETTFMKRKVISDMIKYINSNIEKSNENSKLNQEFKNLDLILEKVKTEMFKNQNEIPPSKLVNNFFTYNNLVSNPLVISNFLIEYMDKNELKYIPSIVSNLNIQSINNILVHFKDNVEFITSLLIHLKSKEQILPFIEFTFNELNNIPYNFTNYLKLSNLLSKLLAKCRASNDLIQLYDKNMVINFTINFIELFYLERIQKHNVDITDVDYILSLILQILYSFGNSIEYFSENLLLILNNPDVDLNFNSSKTVNTSEENKDTLLVMDDYVDSFATEEEPQQDETTSNNINKENTASNILEMNEDEKRVLKFIKLSCQLIIDATSVSSQSINYNKDINILKYLKLILFKTFQLYPNMQASNEDSDIYGSVGNTTSLYGFSIGNRIPFISYHHLKLIRSIGLELSKCFINLVYDPYLPNMETQYFPRIDIEQVQTLIFMIQEIGCNEDIFKELFEMSFDLLKMEITQPFDEIHVLFIKLLTCMICRMNQPPSLSNNFSSNILSSFDNFGNSLLLGSSSHSGNNLNSILNSVEKYLLKSTTSSTNSTIGSGVGGIGSSNNRNSFNGSFGNMSNLIDKATKTSINVEEIYSKALFNSFMLFIHDSIQKYSKNNLMITKELVKSLILIMENNIVLFAVNNSTYSVQWLHELFKNIYKECNLYEDWMLGQYALYGLSKTYAILHSNNAKDVNEDFIIKTMESSLVNSHLKQSALQSILSFIECGNRNIVLKLLPYLASNIQTWLLDKEQTVYNQLLLMKMVTQMVQQYPEASVHQLTKKTMESLFNLSDDIDAPLTIVVTIFKSLQKLLINYSLSQFERSLIEAMTSIKQSTMITRNDNSNGTANQQNNKNDNNTGMMNRIAHPFKKMTIDTSTFSNFTQMLAQNKTMLINRKSSAGALTNSNVTTTSSSTTNTPSTTTTQPTNNKPPVRVSTDKPPLTASSNNISITVGSGIPNTATSSSTANAPPANNTTTKMKQFMNFFTPKKAATPPTTTTSNSNSSVNQPPPTTPSTNTTSNPSSGSGLTPSPSLSTLPMSRSMSMTSIVSSLARSSEKLQTLSQTRRVLLLGLMSTSMYTSSFSTQQQLDSQRERAKVNILHLIEQFHDGEIDREGEIILRFIPQLMVDFFDNEQILPLLYNEFLSSKTHPLLLSLLLSLHMPHSLNDRKVFENWITMSMQTLCLKQPTCGALWALLCLFISVCIGEFDHHYATLVYFGSNYGLVHEWNDTSSHAFLLYGLIFYNYLSKHEMNDAINVFKNTVIPQLIQDSKDQLIYVKLLKSLLFLINSNNGASLKPSSELDEFF